MIGLSGSGRGATVKKKPFMNTIAHIIHHLVAVCDIFDWTDHMEVGNTENSNFISGCVKVMMDEIGPSK